MLAALVTETEMSLSSPSRLVVLHAVTTPMIDGGSAVVGGVVEGDADDG